MKLLVTFANEASIVVIHRKVAVYKSCRAGKLQIEIILSSETCRGTIGCVYYCLACLENWINVQVSHVDVQWAMQPHGKANET